MCVPSIIILAESGVTGSALKPSILRLPPMS